MYFECRSALRSYIQPKCSIFFSSLSQLNFLSSFVHITFDLSRHTRHVFFLLSIFCAVGCFNSFFFCRNKNRRTSRHWLIERFGVFFLFALLSIFVLSFSLMHIFLGLAFVCVLYGFFSLKTLPCRYTKQNDKLYVVSKAHIRMHVCIRFDVCLCTPRHSPSS